MVTKVLGLRHYRQNWGRQEVESVRRSMNEAERQTSFIHSTLRRHLPVFAKHYMLAYSAR